MSNAAHGTRRLLLIGGILIDSGGRSKAANKGTCRFRPNWQAGLEFN
jgi:hypothetical protein